MLSLDQISRHNPVISKELELCDLGDLCLTPSHCTRDVSSGCKASSENATVDSMYDLLQCTLQQAGLPKTVDRTKQPRKGFTLSDVTICILGAPSSFLSVLLEGGNQCPGYIVLCLSSTWLSKVPSNSHQKEYTLLVSKAITFDHGGRTYLDEFEPPRRVTYFTGSFGQCKEEWQAATELGSDLECPTGKSIQLTRLLEDKLLTRLLLDHHGLDVPATLAFTYRKLQAPLCTTAGESIVKMVELSKKEGQENLIQEGISQFLQCSLMEHINQVVVKPAGWHWSRRIQRVSFHPKLDSNAIFQAVVSLLEKLEEEESILVEAFCPTIQPLKILPPESPIAFGCYSFSRPKLAVRICTVVCRSREDRPLLSKVICAVGREDKPVRHQASVPQTLDTTLQQMGIIDKAQQKALYSQIKEKAEAAMSAIIEMEAKLSPEQRGGRRVQTDVLGVDFLLTLVDQTVTVIALELNTHLCLEACAVFETMNRPLAVVGARESAESLLVSVMLKRSQCFIMEGKQILVIGAGGVSKKFVWESARDYGIKIHLIESDPNHFASRIVESFIHYDMTDHKRDKDHAQRVVELVREHGMQLDGCLSFWDDCTVLASLVCELLGLRCSSSSALRIAKQKSLTHLHLLHQLQDHSRWPSAALYAVPCCHLESIVDVEKATRYINFPGVMKLEFGAGAVGVKLVENAEQCQQHYEKISNDLREDTDYPGIGLGIGNAMLLMEYVSGTEHDVDVIIYDSRLMGAFVSDNGPTRVPYFTETAANMPTYLPPDKEAQLVMAAYQCCVGCGLVDGVFNVELKLTPTGPKLIEINPRMGGFYLRDWIQEIYGVDIMLASLMVACSVPPVAPMHYAQPSIHLMGVMCVVSQHLKVLKSTADLETLQSLHSHGVIRLNMLDDEMISSEYEEPYCNVACAGTSREAARLQLISVCRILGIDSPEYPVEYFTSDFK
ncbi:carnosine synthase 1 isoform X2 [Microcaecilia unicolor]|uniref:Carnosine synthase 1 n=1 Tax=Microcaecilia unicolor TaxID=1415580 RepID=A0A6P7WTJ1_9AMPH|nr:carnosine synthase 1 isoform X2 [Microcaecilia unicolor]